MILLSGHSLAEDRPVYAETMSLQLRERDSTAAITLPADELDGIAAGGWLLDDEEPHAGIVWQVRSVQQAFAGKTATVQLEHAISALKDRIMFGEVTPETITGTVGATTCTAEEAAEYILGLQGDWVLGDFDYPNVSNPYRFDGDTLFDALETVTGSLEDAYWTYDMTSYPFTLNIVQKSADVDSEMRAGRNLKTVSRTIDKSGMYTRFYPIGRDDLHITGDYVERNTAAYGVISKVETDQSIDTEAELVRWANERLQVHAEPVVTVAAEGLELARETGEDLDALTIGRVCRIPLPEYGTTIQERITELNYQDKLNQPELVRVTMANIRNDATKIISDMIKRSGRSGRAAAKKDKEDHAWFEDTNDHVAMVAEGIIGVDAQGNPNWTRLSEFIADGEGLHAKVETAIGGVTDRVATLEISEEEIRSDVAASSSQIYTVISQTASGIFTEIANTTSGLRAYTIQTAEYYSQQYSNGKNRVWIQDTDPRSGGATPNVGDIWVESTHQGTWEGAEGFDWEHDEDYDWSQVQGAKIWGWQNGKWELISDQQEVVTMTDVEQTSEHIVQRAIRAMTNDEGELSVYRAELEVKANQIRSEVNELIEGVGSSITQTASAIRSEVHAAQSTIYSEIVQTASSINQKVAYKPIVFVQWEQPTSTEEHTLVNGDLWIKTTKKRYWSNVNDLNWSELDNEFNWEAMKGSLVYVYQDGSWVIAMDEMTLASEVDVEETNDHWQTTARSIDVLEGRATANEAQLKVTSKEIRSYVDNKTDGLGSSITQTAREIRSEVHAAKSTLYSEIKQTASNIIMSVSNTTADLYSRIEITQDSITSSVAAAKSTMYTQIQQTASAIRIEARNAKSDYYAKIQVTSDKIDSSVSAAKSTMYTQIQQTASAIRIEARNAKSDYYAKIQVTSDKIDSSVSAAKSTMYTQIQQTASAIRIEARNAKSDYYAKIQVTSDKIDSSVAAAKSTLYTSIEQTASAIRIEARNAKSDYYSKIEVTSDKIDTSVAAAKSTLYTSIQQTASQIRLEVKNTASGLQSQITTNAGNIELKVSKSGVISSINQTSESITIQASKINLVGYLKSTDITADMITTPLATAQNVNVQRLTLTNNGYIVLPTGDGSVSITGASAVDIIKNLRIQTSGNNYTLQKVTLGNASWQDVATFSRAVSSWTWGGGNGKINVTALPQNQTKPINVSIDGPLTISTNGTYTYTVDYENADGDDVSTEAQKVVTVNTGKTATEYYRASSYWKKPQDNNGKCMIPNIDITAEEEWFSMNHISITRAGWHSTMGNVYKGKLYYWDDDVEDYVPVVNSAKYWYYSDSSKSGTTTVYY